MKIIAYASLVTVLFCASVHAAEPYTYRLITKQDTSYGATKRMVHRIHLNTQSVPDRDRMKATAQQVWKNGNGRWNEFTVFMIFGQIKNFNAGAYGIAEFTPTGLASFRINNVPLQMLELETKTETRPSVQAHFDIPSLVKMNISQIKKKLGKPTKEVTSETVKMRLDVWTAEWKKAPVTLQVDYYPSGKIKSVFIFDSKGSSLTKKQLLSHGNIDEKSKHYKVNIIKAELSDQRPKPIASIEVIPISKQKIK